MNTIEARLLSAADAFEKTASDSTKEETPKSSETLAEKNETDKKDSDTPSKKKEDSKPTDKAIAAIEEELGIEDTSLAEKVASADPSVVEYIKKISQTPVESMGGTDDFSKRASDTSDECPLGSWLANS